MIAKAGDGDPTQNRLDKAIGQAKAVATEDDFRDEDDQDQNCQIKGVKALQRPRTKKTQQITIRRKLRYIAMTRVTCSPKTWTNIWRSCQKWSFPR